MDTPAETQAGTGAESPEQSTFRQWLREHRKAYGYTQEELAQRVSCSTIALRRIEEGVRRPSRQLAELLVAGLDAPPEELDELVRRARSDPLEPRSRPDPTAPTSEYPGYSYRQAHNLPSATTSLVGRAVELDTTRTLLQTPGIRLLTLTGPPGVGKTRLALALAKQMVDLGAYLNGVWLVDLTPLRDFGLVIAAIADIFGLRNSGGTPLVEVLKQYLRKRQLLLVLDNFEQVVDAAQEVNSLLAASPLLSILVASRMPLRLAGEHEYSVAPLSVPTQEALEALSPRPSIPRPHPRPRRYPRRVYSPPVLTEYDAVRLFVERAQAVKPDFQVTEENAPSVARICMRLDGLPLAIELAAARVRLFSPEAMLNRLEHSMSSLLKGGARDLPDRHRTLAGAIEWSYNLLSAAEQRFFRRMAPFINGRTLEALEAVCNYDGQLGVDVLDGVESLVEKSLLREEEGLSREPRFLMLETIHDYAREMLQESSEAEALQRQHALYFLALAQEVEPEAIVERKAQWFDRLEDEHDNLRTALRWAVEQNEAEIAQLLTAYLCTFWEERGYWNEARQWLDAALALVPADPGVVSDTAARARSRALATAAWMAWLQHDHHRARVLTEESMAIVRRLGDTLYAAGLANDLGLVLTDMGEWDAAEDVFRECLAAGREVGDKLRTIGPLTSIGYLYFWKTTPGDRQWALNCLREGLEVARQMGSERDIARALDLLGILSVRDGDYEQAAAYLGEGLAVARSTRDKYAMALLTMNAGWVACLQKDYEEAERALKESLAALSEMGSALFVTHNLGHLALAAAGVGRSERAAILYSAFMQQLNVLGRTGRDLEVSPVDIGKWSERLRRELGEATWAAALARGQAMSMKDAVEYALEEVPTSLEEAIEYALKQAGHE